MKQTLLQLVQMAYRETGYAGALATAQNQTGRAADVVAAVLKAHEEVQLLRPDWRWDWAQGTFDLIAGKDSYNPATDWGLAGGIRSFEREGAYLYRPAQGAAGRLWLGFLDWPTMRQMVVPTVAGFANVFSVAPDGTVRYFPQPEQAYKAVHEYWRHPETLAADDASPRMPADLHLMVGWKAVMLLANATRDWARQDSAEEEYQKFLTRALNEQTESVATGGPLA